MTKNTIREIRYHAIFWVIYFILWGARDMVFYPALIENTIVNLIFSLPAVPFIYLNLYYLVPKYLFKKKWGIYSLLFIIGFIIITWLRFHLTHYIYYDIFGATEAVEQFSGWTGVVIVGSENLTVILITMALFFVREWYIKERYTRELEQKNTESELNMLKAQLQPHFLFNNLNTIYFLMETDPVLAKDVMIRFSEVLSHQLYNAKKDKVPLKEELDNLESYLEIQRIRHEDFLDLKYILPKQTDDLQIAPMILFTFIENAFKHSQREEGYRIDIDLNLQGQELRLHVVNTNGYKEENESSGVGLENVKRRLELIYPDRHTLEINETEETYSINLTLTLEPNGQA